ncbi:MAG: hypothetical protein ACR2JJ_04055 [Sphingomicrobium sp.]
MADRQELVRKAIAKLPLLSAVTDDDLDQSARFIVTTSSIMAVNRLPRANNSQARDGARKEVERLAELCFDLGKHIQAMRSDALRPLERAGCKPHPLALVDTLKDVIRAACDALDEGHFPAPQHGAPEKRYEKSVADKLLRTYQHFTGRKATVPSRDGKAYGPFLDFMADVMPLLGIRSGFESQARAAIKRSRG